MSYRVTVCPAIQLFHHRVAVCNNPTTHCWHFTAGTDMFLFPDGLNITNWQTEQNRRRQKKQCDATEQGWKGVNIKWTETRNHHGVSWWESSKDPDKDHKLKHVSPIIKLFCITPVKLISSSDFFRLHLPWKLVKLFQKSQKGSV